MCEHKWETVKRDVGRGVIIITERCSKCGQENTRVITTSKVYG